MKLIFTARFAQGAESYFFLPVRGQQMKTTPSFHGVARFM
jgi:hypothetical protein